MRRAILGLCCTALIMAGGALAARSDKLEPAAKEGRALFNGRDLSGWKLRHPEGKNGWKVVDGVLVNTPPSTDLVTEETFKDFHLHVEYRIPPGSNSGIYLRGRYEIQINDDYGKAVTQHINGAIYGLIPPAENATRPAGEWQTVDATLVGRRVTVILNGKKIIDNQVIEGPTGGALDNREAEPGPIMLQGDHGVVEFRNIGIKPI
jgi:hypothetical protein